MKTYISTVQGKEMQMPRGRKPVQSKRVRIELELDMTKAEYVSTRETLRAIVAANFLGTPVYLSISAEDKDLT